ncbi:hypothetical protein TKK_0015354 [Trichogramma kaykai]
MLPQVKRAELDIAPPIKRSKPAARLKDFIDELEDDARLTSHITMSLTNEDLKKFSRSFLKNHATLLSMIANEQTTEKNKKIQAAMNMMWKEHQPGATASKTEAAKTQSAKSNVESTCCRLSQRSYARITVGPKESVEVKMRDAPTVKAALVRSVNPATLGGRMKRMHYGRGGTVVIEGEGLCADTFS